MARKVSTKTIKKLELPTYFDIQEEVMFLYNVIQTYYTNTKYLPDFIPLNLLPTQTELVKLQITYDSITIEKIRNILLLTGDTYTLYEEATYNTYTFEEEEEDTKEEDESSSQISDVEKKLNVGERMLNSEKVILYKTRDPAPFGVRKISLFSNNKFLIQTWSLTNEKNTIYIKLLQPLIEKISNKWNELQLKAFDFFQTPQGFKKMNKFLSDKKPDPSCKQMTEAMNGLIHSSRWYENELVDSSQRDGNVLVWFKYNEGFRVPPEILSPGVFIKNNAIIYESPQRNELNKQKMGNFIKFIIPKDFPATMYFESSSKNYVVVIPSDTQLWSQGKRVMKKLTIYQYRIPNKPFLRELL